MPAAGSGERKGGGSSGRRKNWKQAPKKDEGDASTYQPRSPGMARWNEKYNPRSKKEGGKSFTPRSQLSESPPATEESVKYQRFSVVLIFLAFFGGFFMQMGVDIGPNDCENDNFFEVVGGMAFFFSMIGIPVNGFVLFISFFDEKLRSSTIFKWSLAHLGIVFLMFILFGNAILQDMWCGGNGPHYDIGAGF
ncbi:MAG: hypothetical protein DWC03_03675 [Candidatus Poseidoniales archaeon]|nr:MAG: hypothetical protein DWC03_03675 [Candidatus Poseidoniales archaeon]